MDESKERIFIKKIEVKNIGRFYGSHKDGSKKTHADIFDVLVKPVINQLDGEALRLETSIVKSQLNRIQQMGELALNRDACMKKIQEFTAGMSI